MKVDLYFGNSSVFSQISSGGVLTIQCFYCSTA